MTTFKDMNLQVGMRVQMALQYLQHNDPKQQIYFTELIGYVEGEYLVIKTPVENGLSVQMQEQEMVSLRILSGVNIYTLTCQVKTIFSAPHHYIHLSFPTDIKSVALRGAIRTKVNLPVKISETFVITDISVTGAAIIANRVLGEINDEISISFEFPIKHTNHNAQIDTNATILSIQQLSSTKKGVAAPAAKYSHGVSFHELDLTRQMMLLNLVYESMNKM